MSPYHITIDWVDYNTTLEEDMYQIKVWDASESIILIEQTVSKTKIAKTLDKYLCGRHKC